MARPKAWKTEETAQGDSGENLAKLSLEKARAKAKDPKPVSENPPNWKGVHRDANYSGKTMIELNESGIIINGDFTGANLDDTDFTFVKDGISKGFILQGCKFDGASLKGTNFAGCDLRWSTFTNNSAAEAYFAAFDEKGNVIDGSEANLFEVKGL
jgi:uncharacterized protein YjbI with pentapeptide repeats